MFLRMLRKIQFIDHPDHCIQVDSSLKTISSLMMEIWMNTMVDSVQHRIIQMELMPISVLLV